MIMNNANAQQNFESFYFVSNNQVLLLLQRVIATAVPQNGVSVAGRDLGFFFVVWRGSILSVSKPRMLGRCWDKYFWGSGLTWLVFDFAAGGRVLLALSARGSVGPEAVIYLSASLVVIDCIVKRL